MNFFSRPHEFSFKDLLAAMFSGFFFFCCYRALESPHALQLVATIYPLQGVVLGGYFLQEGGAAIASTWAQRGLLPTNQPYNTMPAYQPTGQSSYQTVNQRPPDIAPEP